MCKKLTAVNKYRLELTSLLICRKGLVVEFCQASALSWAVALGLEKWLKSRKYLLLIAQFRNVVKQW